MNTAGHDQSLEDVLDAYVAANDAPSHAALAAWTRRYPQYERELAEFTANWSLMRWLPPSPTAAPASEPALVQQGMAAIQNMLQRRATQQEPSTEAPIASLLEEGRARGLAVDALAERAGLSIPLVLKLDRRLIRAATIPAQVIESVAHAIGRDVAGVAAYLQGGPRLAPGASYHAGEAPTLAGQEDFAAAVRADLTLPADRRAQLLALPPAEPQAQ